MARILVTNPPNSSKSAGTDVAEMFARYAANPPDPTLADALLETFGAIASGAAPNGAVAVQIPTLDKKLAKWSSDVRTDVIANDTLARISPPPGGWINAPSFGASIASLNAPGNADGLDGVLAKKGLRANRKNEILTQASTLVPYFAALFGLQPERHTYTMELFVTASKIIVAPVMFFKHELGVPRPVELDAEVAPLILTPEHGSTPSGHAAQAMFQAAILACLVGVSRYSSQAIALANRIAENRVIAGVHYQFDTELSYALVMEMLPRVLAIAAGQAPQAWTPLNATVDLAGISFGTAYQPLAAALANPAGAQTPLQWLWKKARAEWS